MTGFLLRAGKWGLIGVSVLILGRVLKETANTPDPMDEPLEGSFSAFREWEERTNEVQNL